ncbi:MAG: chaperonin GroEL [Promethearchaeota archaeon]|jgi:chaperonin GroEL
MAKQMAFQQDARDAMRRGVERLTKAVKSTLGPCGRNVAIEKSFGAPQVTKDGVTVAREIELPEAYENMGAQMVKEVASKTSDIAGDGTTTATIYAEAIFTEGLKNIAAGAEAMELKRGIEAAVKAIIAELDKMKVDVAGAEHISQVGTCAANQNPDIGEKIAQAMDKVGKDGVITVEESKSLDTTVDLVEGMQFDKGFLSPHFVINHDSQTCVLDKPFILVHEKQISNIRDLIPLLEKVAEASAPILIIAEDITGEALATLVVNHLRGTFKCCAVKAPGFGDRRKAMLEDIATLTGATAVMADLGTSLEHLAINALGRAKKVTIDKDNTTIIEGAGQTDEIKGRIEQIRHQIHSTDSDYDREKLEERLARLSGGVAQINVGAATEIEMKEKKALVEDALHACRAAVEEGILAGGGVAVVRAAAKIMPNTIKKLRGDQKTGAQIVERAIVAPLKQIAENAGKDGSIVWKEVIENSDINFGYNALTGVYGDLIEMGVLVPTKVERVALTNAASVASLLLTTDCAISEIKEDSKNTGDPPMGGMPGMM